MNTKQKILIVDDSRGWLDYHKYALTQVLGDRFELETADSARMGYDRVYNNIKEPYVLIISDMQMEYDFEPKYAGEWFIEQVKLLKEYKSTPIIAISAAYNLKTIADNLNVNYLPKASAARNLNTYKLAIEETLK